MRALAAGVMAAGLLGLGLAVVIAGRAIDSGHPDAALDLGQGETYGPPIPPDFQPLDSPLHAVSQAARPVDPDLVAPPPVQYDTLVRAEPRDPLGPLGQAQPPRKKGLEGGGLLYQPVATGSAVFEAMGYKIAIAGTRSIAPEETCTHDGAEWPCGVRARTAVRLWLRGRALSCDVPPDIERELIVVGCRLGKQDVGAWLVANGWAHAVKGGPYEDAEAQAREAGLGIFGAAPPAVN